MCVHPQTNSIDPNHPSTMVGVVALPKFSFYRRPIRNTVPERELSLLEVYQLIKSERYLKQTAALRAMTDKAQARAFKAESFDYCTFSGTFIKRDVHSLVQHSGLMALDLDHVTDLQALKKALLKDLFFETQLLFRSPSGDGLKWIVSIDLDKASHLDWFNAISNYVSETYHFKLDASGKDVPRACFFPHDSEIYIHPSYLTSSFSNPLN